MPIGLTQKGAAARDRIIVGAAEVLREHGVRRTGLEAIRDATGTSSSQLFHYFPGGKSQLMLAVAEYEAAQILEQQRPLLGDFGDAFGLHTWGKNFLTQIERDGSNCALGALLSQLDPSDEEVRAIVARMYEQWEDELAKGIRLLQLDGQVGQALSAEKSAAALLAGIQGGVLMLLATGTSRHLRTALELGLDALHPAAPQ
jgi:AcrR family transcriptional regulator